MARTYKIGDVELKVNVIPPLKFNWWNNEFAKTWQDEHGRGEPKPPQQVVNILNKPSHESNPEDALYKARHAAFNRDYEQAMFDYCISYVETEPPEDFALDEYTIEFIQNRIDNGEKIKMSNIRKRHWIYGLLTKEEDLTNFMTAVIGQESPVESEVQQELDEFQPDGSE